MYFKSFETAALAFCDAEQAFQSVVVEVQRRQLRILKVPDQDIVRLTDHGYASLQDVLKVALSEDTDSVIRSIDDRHAQVLQLEDSVRDVQRLFAELALLVDTQQTTLDSIEVLVGSAKNLTEKGERKLTSAERYQIKDRKCKCKLIILMLVVVSLVILLPILTS